MIEIGKDYGEAYGLFNCMQEKERILMEIDAIRDARDLPYAPDFDIKLSLIDDSRKRGEFEKSLVEALEREMSSLIITGEEHREGLRGEIVRRIAESRVPNASQLKYVLRTRGKGASNEEVARLTHNLLYGLIRCNLFGRDHIFEGVVLYEKDDETWA